MLHDLQPGAAPRTTFDLVIEALSRRRERGLAPFTVMSCDNIQGNGDVARKMFTAFAKLKDPELGAWIAENVPFPNSMVDRITPVTTDADREAIAEELGIEDAWPVVCEPFEQWVLEDNFGLGRLPFEDAGVQLIRRSVDVKTVPLVPIDTATSPGLRVKSSAAPALSPHPAATRVPVAVVPAVAEGSITVGRSGDLPNAHSTRSCR